MKKKKGNLFVISGPSGVGKGTILEHVFKNDKNLVFSVSATTRPPRPHEEEGKEYFFVSNEKFQDMIKKNEFLEWAFVHGNYYGTPAEFVNKKINDGLDVVLDIDVQGARQVMKCRPDGIFIFIAPPEMDTEVLRTRLMGRNTEPTQDIQKRIETAILELKDALYYEYIIFNDQLEEAVKDLEAIIRSVRCKSRIYRELNEKRSYASYDKPCC